jgi:hypothetical protein
MSQLRIAILGELQISRVDDNGRCTPIELSGGEKLPGLLAALVFYSETTDRMLIAKLVCGEEDVDNDPKKYRDRIYQQSLRLKLKLNLHEGLVTEGLGPLKLLGRTRTVEQQRPLLIDWDLFKEARNARQHAEVVSLVRANPLPSVNEETTDIGELVGCIREMVRKQVAESLRALGLPVPEPLVLGEHLPDDFEYRLPDEWSQSTDEPQSEAPSPLITTTARHPPRIKPLGAYEHSQLFEGCGEGERRLAKEEKDAEKRGASLWWSDGLGDWFGRYFAFWSKTLTTPCEQVGITYSDDGDRYDSARFGGPPQDKGNDKAVIVAASTMFSEDSKELLCGKTNWGFAYKWAKDNAEKLLDLPVRPSVFGVTDRPAYPGIAGVHTLMQTCDGYLLFALRGSRIGFHKLTWSASFEESVSVGVREFTGPLTSGDKTILHTIAGGLYEEWGVDEDVVADSTCLAVGREWVREDNHLDLNSTVLATVRLSITLDELWASLDEASYIRDRHEHRAWAGCRF